MLSINDLKSGVAIEQNGEPYEVIESCHVKMGRGGAMMRTKLKNLINGNALEKTFKGSDKIFEADIESKKALFLYHDKEKYYFMDAETFDHVSLTKESLGKGAYYLKDGQEVDLLYFNDKPINIDLPIKIEQKIVETEPGVRGNTAQGGANKIALTETNLKLSVPLFIKEGDMVRIDTRTGNYLERI